VYPILFFVGPIGIRTAVVIVVVAVVVATRLSVRRLEQRALPPPLASDFVGPGLVAALVGARLSYAVAFDPAWYVRRPIELLAVWKGGFAEEGGFLGALAAAAWWCRRRRVSFWAFADALAPGVALGQALARVGALLGGAGYGTPTSLPWAVTFLDPNSAAPLGIPLHPTQAYETLAGLFLTAVLLLAERRGPRAGGLFLLLVIGLALERGLFDLVRGDAIWISGWVTSGQVVGILVAGTLGLTRRAGRAGSRDGMTGRE
jgi:phosphatidylglycerol:prolipoprotein diacylglycerol transferase